MEKWYLPITILPGVGLLLMSTSNLLNALGAEISYLIKEDCERMHQIIEQKINQLSLLNRAMVGFYLSAACLVLAGLAGGLSTSFEILHQGIIKFCIILAIGSILVSLILLTFYAYRAVTIKKQQFQQTLASGTRTKV